MESINRIALMGGIFGIFVMIHFTVDWLLQTHAEAMAKHNNATVRARHCLIYTIGFIPLLLWLHFSLIHFVIAINILFWSHFIEDTYLPVYIWAKYIRKPPEMFECIKEVSYKEDGSTLIKVYPPDPKKGFVKFVETTLGKILMIAVDQIIHLLFLLPLAWMTFN